MIRKVLTTVAETFPYPQVQNAPIINPFVKTETSYLGWLTNMAPCFPINANNITILSEPTQFYEYLLQCSNQATERITLASLYLGNGELEKKLVDTILNNKHFSRLKIDVLLDYSRGSRFKNNSRRMLLPLLKDNTNNCNISLYHTPILRGLYKKLAPNRWNELFGIQHMKVYIFDNTMIMSGANLSNDYFTNRQDRYFIIKDRNICNFFCGLVNIVQNFSLKINSNDDVYLNEGWGQLPYEGSKDTFIQNAGDLVESYINKNIYEQNNHKKEGYDTWIFPMIQMGQLGISQDSNLTDKLFAEAPYGSKLNLATAYFNLTNRYAKTLIYNSKAECSLLMAHPKANGFFGAKGMAGGVPDGYTLLCQRFLSKLSKSGEMHRFSLKEYLREGWTFHCKGLWYYSPNSNVPCLTLIGSPNFGDRSVLKDLETQVAIVTENKALQQELHKECTQIYDSSQPADVKRKIPAWVYAMVFLFKDFF